MIIIVVLLLFFLTSSKQQLFVAVGCFEKIFEVLNTIKPQVEASLKLAVVVNVNVYDLCDVCCTGR